MPALRRSKARQKEEKMRHRNVWDEGDLNFPNEIGKPIERQNLVRRLFKLLLTKAELPDAHFHNLRHTTASLLLRTGEHALGH